MSAAAMEKLIWVLVYGGLLVVCLGVFVQREHQPIGWTLIVVGAIATAVGAFFVWVRSRLPR